MPTIFQSLLALLLGSASFVAAAGLAATTVALTATQLGFSETVIGLVLSAYFAGFVVGTYVGPRIIARTGHIRAFCFFSSTACVPMLLHPLVPVPGWWALFRFLAGASIVGLYMVTESWLNERATNEYRGTVFSTYQAVSLVSLGLGQYLLLLGPPTLATPFLVTGALLALALLPIALTRLPEPKAVRPARLNLGYLWKVSPLGVLGTAITAVAGSTLFSLGPIYANAMEMSTREVAIFMSVIIFGGAALQRPIGRLSDVVDRRTVILLVAAAGSLLAAAELFVPRDWTLTFHVIAFCYGGAVFSLYPLCVAHAGDHVTVDQLVVTASGLLLVYGLGAVVGPLLGGLLLGRFGPLAFFAILSSALGFLAAAAILRMLLRPPPPPETHDAFVAHARTSQSALEMLPDAAAGDSRDDE